MSALSHLMLVQTLCEGHILKEREVCYRLMSNSTLLDLIINLKPHLIFNVKNKCFFRNSGKEKWR